MEIRPPRWEDLRDIVELGAAMHEESAYSFLPYNREKVRSLAECFVTQPDVYGGFVAADSGILAGMIGGYLTDYFFCDAKVASDMVLFLDRRYRGGTTAARLILAFERWAVRQGAVELCLGISTSINVEKTGRFYEHLGMQHVGALYKKRLEAPDV